MVSQTLLILALLSTGHCDFHRERRKHENPNKSLWKKEYENELTDAILLTKKKGNTTRKFQSAVMSDNESVLEKLMEMITSSEKYLKKVDSIDFRLNRLDIEVHEKTNSIMKQLAGIMTSVQADECADKVGAALEALQSRIKHFVEKWPRMDNTDGQEYRADTALDSRLTSLDSGVKGVAAGVNTILATIAEVKNRQYSKPYAKSESAMSIDTLNLINEFRRTVQEQKAKKCDCREGRFDRTERYPTDCREIQSQGFNVSGIYKIKPDDMEPFYVLCDLTTAGGGWTVFQNRFDGSQDFYKSWFEYKHGFGNLAGEFWLGLEKLSYLTNQKLYELRVEMETPHGQEAFAGYSVFTVGPEHEGYRISTLGTYYGTAGDSLSYHAGQKFSTSDVDNDEWSDGTCAAEHGGAWWYKECDKSNLNGRFALNTEEQQGQSIYWISFKGLNSPLSKTKMMIRPLPTSRPIITDTRKIESSSNQRGPSEGQKSMRPKDKPPYDVLPSPYRYGERTHADAYIHRYA